MLSSPRQRRRRRRRGAQRRVCESEPHRLKRGVEDAIRRHRREQVDADTLEERARRTSADTSAAPSRRMPRRAVPTAVLTIRRARTVSSGKRHVSAAAPAAAPQIKSVKAFDMF